MNNNTTNEILMVEDSPTQAEQLKYILERNGYHVHAARNGRKALELLDDINPKLIISDIVMPEMDGYELCRQIRARNELQNMPVVLLTSLSDPEDIIKGLECGADNFITKPFDEDYLLSRIQYIFANKRFRQYEQASMGVEVHFAGRKQFITSDKLQILNLLLSTFETAVRKNKELIAARDELKKLADDLEMKVQERTAALTREIEDRKHAEEHIRQQAALLEKARDAILVCDLESRIIFWNKGAERIYGWTTSEAVGESFEKLLSKPGSLRTSEVRQEVAATGEWMGELIHVTKTGKTVVLQSHWTCVRNNGDEKPNSILIINSDITEQKELESRFLRAQRLESIGILASGIAHDLNNVLAPILMGAQLLRMNIEDPGTLESIDVIENSAQNGADLIKQILSFGRGVGGDRVDSQVGHVIRDVYKLLQETFPRSIEIRVYTPNDLWLVTAVTTQLHQVLMNLCVNARDAMPSGGRMEIRAENLLIDENYAQITPDAKPGRYVLITISDTGTGIPPEVMKNLYEPFFTTKEVGKGTGLGLSTVKTIVKNHEGFIHVYSELGKGTHFRVYLPASSSAVEKEIERPKKNIPRGAGECVLVVDDEPNVRHITVVTLERYGYHVLAAKDGTEALATYIANQQQIQLVLTDMMMPVMGGPALIGALRGINPNVAIVGLSGMADTAELGEMEGVEMIPKPFSTEQLLTSVKKSLPRS